MWINDDSFCMNDDIKNIITYQIYINEDTIYIIIDIQNINDDIIYMIDDTTNIKHHTKCLKREIWYLFYCFFRQKIAFFYCILDLNH